MDRATSEIRYQQWVQVIQAWNSSGLSKRDYCQQNGINEKQFYYYQRRIRAIIAAQADQPGLPEGRPEIAELSAEQRSIRPQIVKLQIPSMEQTGSSTISFSVNGMNFSVPENIPASFLAKLLEAASHGTR